MPEFNERSSPIWQTKVQGLELYFQDSGTLLSSTSSLLLDKITMTGGQSFSLNVALEFENVRQRYSSWYLSSLLQLRTSRRPLLLSSAEDKGVGQLESATVLVVVVKSYIAKD
jgi:hypothetical protein